MYIRVDGNEIIATGHVMRCLSIADQLRGLGMEAVFLLADDRPEALIRSRGFAVEVLGTVWNDLDRETEVLCAFLKENRVQALLLDSYFVTYDYLRKLSNHTKVVYIDDLYRFAYPVHTLINYSVFCDRGRYEELYAKEKAEMHLLTGGDYIPLREEFVYQPYKVRQKVEKVLVTTGGTDLLNVAGSLLDAVLRDESLRKLEYHVIAGCFHNRKEQLYELAAIYHNIKVYENVTNMAERMRDCDVAVSASGSTLYELCACGVPAICLEIAQNQQGAVSWEKNGCMRYAGNAELDLEGCVKSCVDGILWYQEHYGERCRMSQRMQALVDGQGAGRIAEYLKRL